MGSSSSKDGSASSSSSSASAAAVGAEIRRSRSMGSRVFQSSCLGRSLRSYNTENDDQVYDDRNKENWSLSRVSTCPDQNGTESDQVKQEGRRKVKLHQQPNEVPSISSNAWGQEIVAESGSMADEGVPPSLSSRSLVSSSRSHSRFSFIPGNMSFRLSRAASLGSTRACSIFSNSITTSNSEEGLNVHSNSSVHSLNRNGTRQGCDLFPISGPSSEHYEVSTTSSALRFDPAASGLSVGLQDDAIVSRRDRSRYNVNTGILSDTNARTPRNHTEIDRIETRRANRRTGDREPVERSVRFSRTLSVGRLRDRVLRRSSVTDGLSGRQHEDREVGDTTQGNRRQVSSDTTRTPASDTNAEISPASSSYPPSSISDYVFHGQEVEASRPREARYHDIMEHRTDFLERRRRIRSQVRALQRLGSRFENLSGHERSCILSGQHRTGRCSCRTNNRTRNLDDDTSARASISRIVMLAEALFEVLDEIHQQSVVLSSRPSVSSLGSVPAPKEVVESMPVKIYTKLQKHQSEDVAQCYICLLEYEEGDCMRILPCHHEFHRACIDKWLKEIHRVCPLCRGDVCRSDSLPLEN